jgi:GWxTD domain-containing protein
MDPTGKEWKQENIGRAYFIAPKGNYRVYLESQDIQNPDLKIRKDFQLSINPFPKDELCSSDIEIASEIQLEKSIRHENPFYKNSLFVIPRPSLFFGAQQSLLYFYIEIYNISKGIKQHDYTIQASIVDSANQAVPGVQPILRKKKKLHDSIVEFGEIGLFSLPSSAYYVKVTVIDSIQQEVLSKRKKFYIYNPKNIASPINIKKDPFDVSPFASLDEKGVKLEIEQVRYIMTDQQKSTFKSLKKLDAKTKYLYEFWRAMDPNPNTPENEFYIEYKTRIEYTDLHFGTMKKKGWMTDRGRVYLVYGPPSDIERFPSSSQYGPYEIWQYNSIEGGVIFIFTELSGFENYTLIHSTKNGEVYNPEYMNMIQRGF